MTVPSWWETILLALAAYRVWRLLSEDVILDPLRSWMLKMVRPEARRTRLAQFIDCPFCLGFWTAVAWWGAWEAWPHGTLVAAAPWAIAAAAAIIATRVEPE